MVYGGPSSGTPNEASKMLRASAGLAELAPPGCFFFRPLFRQLAEPAQSDRSLSVIHFVPATESPDSHSIESSSLD